MPKFVYVGVDARTFPDTGLVVEPGEMVEADENPDTRWFDATIPVATSDPVDPAPTEEP